ncbi:MAG: DNA repair protein RadC [Bacteroidales bacterium]|nr:DNA repair protein RadC [Bacteroidales bacterium]
MKIKDLCEDERPREKMLDKGADTLSNTELLAILLRTGTEKMNVIDVARELLKSGENKLNEIATMSVEVLCRINGIGPSKAVTLAAAFELGRRCAAEKAIDIRTAITSPKTVFRMMLPILRGLDHEECWILFLNRANYLISKEKLSSGGLDSTTLDCRHILKKALEKKASGIIIVHNHPSGSALPGSADIQSTRQLDRALKACDISLLDHVVIAQDNYYSFADEELVQC